MTADTGIGGDVPGLFAGLARKIMLVLPFAISACLFATVIYVHLD